MLYSKSGLQVVAHLARFHARIRAPQIALAPEALVAHDGTDGGGAHGNQAHEASDEDRGDGVGRIAAHSGTRVLLARVHGAAAHRLAHERRVRRDDGGFLGQSIDLRSCHGE